MQQLLRGQETVFPGDSTRKINISHYIRENADMYACVCACARILITVSFSIAFSRWQANEAKKRRFSVFQWQTVLLKNILRAFCVVMVQHAGTRHRQISVLNIDYGYFSFYLRFRFLLSHLSTQIEKVRNHKYLGT